MECNNIKQKLSGYLEDALSQEERVQFEDHLKSCAGCRADLADLRKTVEHIKGLEEVEPPAWMSQKIMARVREEGRRKKGILQRLFYPLHLKLPLEAVAAVLVVGLAIYVYRDINPEVKLARTPTVETSPKVLPREIIKEDKIGPFKKSEEKNIPQEVTIAPEKAAKEPAQGKSEAKDKMESAVPKAPEPQRQSQFVYEEQRAAPTPATEAARSMAGAIRQEAKREAVQAAPGLKALAEKKTESMILIIKVSELESAGKEIEKNVVALGGKITKRQSLEEKKTLVAEIESNKLSELIEKLKSIGEVKEVGKTKGREGILKVNVELIENR